MKHFGALKGTVELMLVKAWLYIANHWQWTQREYVKETPLPSLPKARIPNKPANLWQLQKRRKKDKDSDLGQEMCQIGEFKLKKLLNSSNNLTVI